VSPTHSDATRRPRTRASKAKVTGSFFPLQTLLSKSSMPDGASGGGDRTVSGNTANPSATTASTNAAQVTRLSRQKPWLSRAVIGSHYPLDPGAGQLRGRRSMTHEMSAHDPASWFPPAVSSDPTHPVRLALVDLVNRDSGYAIHAYRDALHQPGRRSSSLSAPQPGLNR
jgi:hypothetical protein